MKVTGLVGVSLAVLLLAGGCSDDSPVSTTSTTAPAEYTDAELATIEEAEARARAYVAAVNEGRVDEMERIVGAPLEERDERHFEFHSILNSSGIEWSLGECEVESASESMVKLSCDLSYSEPVFVAVGAGESIWPFTLVGGQLFAESWVPVGNDFTDALSAYMEYMKAFHPDDHALCDPAQQSGQFWTHGGLARVPECAPAMIKHSNAVVEWIEAGRPTE